MKSYKFNDLGVCLNPDVLEVTYKSVSAEISYCKVEDGFNFAIGFETPYSGHSSPVTNKSNSADIEQGLNDSYNKILNHIESMINSKNSCKPAYLDEQLVAFKSRFSKIMVTIKNTYQYDLDAYLKDIKQHKESVQTDLFSLFS